MPDPYPDFDPRARGRLSADIERVIALPEGGRLAGAAWLNGRLARSWAVGPGGRPDWCPEEPWMQGWRGEPIPGSNPEQAS